MPIFLRNWGVLYPGSPIIILHGEAYGHPRHKNGSRVITTPVDKADGVTITTDSGSVYELGKISKNYRDWLRTNKPNWDPENPIMGVRDA